MMENPITLDDLGVPPFTETPISFSTKKSQPHTGCDFGFRPLQSFDPSDACREPPASAETRRDGMMIDAMKGASNVRKNIAGL